MGPGAGEVAPAAVTLKATEPPRDEMPVLVGASGCVARLGAREKARGEGPRGQRGWVRVGVSCSRLLSTWTTGVQPSDRGRRAAWFSSRK